MNFGNRELYEHKHKGCVIKGKDRGTKYQKERLSKREDCLVFDCKICFSFSFSIFFFQVRKGWIQMGNLLCCVQVNQSTVAIKERFGRFDEVLEPGCHCLPWCLGSQLAGHLSLRLQQLDVRCETKTKVLQ